MCVRLLGALVFLLFQSINHSQGVRIETEEQILDLVERILVQKTATLSDKVHSLEKTVKNQQSRIYHLEKNGRRNERRIKGMEMMLTDIRTELKLNRFEAYERNTSIDVGYQKEKNADKFGKIEFDNERSVSVSSEETSRLSKKMVAEISRQSVNDHHDTAMLQLVVDGSNIVDIIVDPDSYTEEAMSGNTVIIHVNQGQSVWIQEYYTDNGSIWSNDIGRYCTFSGVLLH